MSRPCLLYLATVRCLSLGTAHGATITVLSGADVVADDGRFTLREAIENASTDCQNGRIRGGNNAQNFATSISERRLFSRDGAGGSIRNREFLTLTRVTPAHRVS